MLTCVIWCFLKLLLIDWLISLREVLKFLEVLLVNSEGLLFIVTRDGRIALF
jgi:hypothetical protein